MCCAVLYCRDVVCCGTILSRRYGMVVNTLIKILVFAVLLAVTAAL